MNDELISKINSIIGVNFGKKGGFIKTPDFSGLDIKLTPQNRIDFKRLTIYSVVASMDFENFDFSFLKFSEAGQFANRNTFKNCVFDSSRLGTNLRDTFIGCTFTKANISGSVLGKTFIDTSFVKANMSKVMGREIVFTNCNFQLVKSQKFDFSFCKFKNCNFSESSFSNGSFHGSSFENCEFKDFSCDDVILSKTTGLKS